MPKGIIRVPEGTQLSTKLSKALEKRFPLYVLENYSLRPDYKKSYAMRMASLYRAFEFLLDAYPPFPLSKETLATYAKNCIENYMEKVNSLINRENLAQKLQEILVQFTAQLVDAVGAGWDKTGLQAAELLNEAEQYELMSQERVNLVTLTPIKFSSNDVPEYVIQWEESLPSYYDELIAELEVIKAENYPKTPSWLRDFESPATHFMHAYFCNLKSISINLIEDFDQLIAIWKQHKESLKISQELKDIAKGKSKLPNWFNILPAHHQEMMKELTLNNIASIDTDLSCFREKLVHERYENSLTQIIKIPQWYWVLSDHQQYFLEKTLKNKATTEHAVSFICSRHRTLPLPANFARHSLFYVTDNGEFTPLFSPVTRSSHVTSRAGIRNKWPLAVQHRHALANLIKVLSDAKSDQTILFQTLVSPIKSISLFSKTFPDGQLHEISSFIITNSFLKNNTTGIPHIVQTNHPFNVAKVVLYTVEKNPNITEFIQSMEQYVAKISSLNELLGHYKNVLHSGAGTATIRELGNGFGRELFLSSLEQLMILTIKGYSYGSCVSGKDRKAISLIHTDAMALYFLKYGCWPSFTDTPPNRANFVSLVADLYLSRHHQEHAGQNAPGADGIKTPDSYFPKDIAAEITNRLGSDFLENDNLLATNNEIREISKGNTQIKYLSKDSLTASDRLLCTLIAEQLGEEQCNKLYTALYLATNDINLFIPHQSYPFFKTNQNSPTGIDKIKVLMSQPNAGTNVERIEAIFKIILERPEYNSSRRQATNTVYNLRELLKPNEKNKSFDELFEQKIIEYSELFNTSRKAYLEQTISQSTHFNKQSSIIGQ